MQQNPWDIPPPPQIADPSREAIFEAVGRALSFWEWFEGNLALIFASVVGGNQDDGFAAMRAYGSIISFRSRSEMLRTAAEVYFAARPDVDLERQLSELLRRATKLAARRNEIAPGIVNPYLPPTEEEGFALFPAYYATAKRAFEAENLKLQITRPAYIYGSNEIETFGNAFATLVEPALAIATKALHAKRRTS